MLRSSGSKLYHKGGVDKGRERGAGGRGGGGAAVLETEHYEKISARATVPASFPAPGNEVGNCT